MTAPPIFILGRDRLGARINGGRSLLRHHPVHTWAHRCCQNWHHAGRSQLLCRGNEEARPLGAHHLACTASCDCRWWLPPYGRPGRTAAPGRYERGVVKPPWHNARAPNGRFTTWHRRAAHVLDNLALRIEQHQFRRSASPALLAASCPSSCWATCKTVPAHASLVRNHPAQNPTTEPEQMAIAHQSGHCEPYVAAHDVGDAETVAPDDEQVARPNGDVTISEAGWRRARHWQ